MSLPSLPPARSLPCSKQSLCCSVAGFKWELVLMSCKRHVYLQCCFQTESTSCEDAEGNSGTAFMLHCKQEAVVNEVQVSKPPLLIRGWEVLFLCQLGIHSLSCLKLICCIGNQYLATTGWLRIFGGGSWDYCFLNKFWKWALTKI